MPGGQVEKPLLTIEIPAKEIENPKVCKISERPITITVTDNGLEIQSCLNPNASEFVPSYLQKEPHNTFNDKINEVTIAKNSTNIEEKITVKVSDKEEQLKPNARKSDECFVNKDTFQNVENVREEKKIPSMGNKIKLDADPVLNESICEVKNYICETVKSISLANEVENSPLDDKITDKSKHNDINIENGTEEIVEECNISLVTANGQEKDTEIVYLFSKQNNPNNNIIKSNEINSPEEQYKKEEPKKKFNVISKIARAPAIVNKLSLSKTPQSKEPKRVIQIKPVTTTNKNYNLTKDAKSNLATKSNTNSKYSSSILNKSTVQSVRKEVPKSFNKDTISNRSTSSTEKSSSSKKSYPQTIKVTSAGKVVYREQKIKEHVPKSPRATVSSKLRKTETQKRGNLFFDIDTIKMSEFLFK